MTVSVKPLELVGENENGSTYVVTSRPTAGYILAFRKAGSQFGNHYHKGISPSKSPEIMLVFSGQLHLLATDLNGDEVYNKTIEAPSKIEIGTNLIHRLEALTDVAFLELNSLEEHQQDTFRKD